MPIDYRIDRRKKIVTVTPRGTLTHEEMVAYQTKVWSRSDVGGYAELIDMSVVDKLDLRSPDQIFELAALGAKMDAGNPLSRMAIVATDKLHAALGRMYRASRTEHPSNQREIEVFGTLEDALKWLRREKRPPRGKPQATTRSRRRP
jgi:hypothetical protein